jgi:hypothetical protein
VSLIFWNFDASVPDFLDLHKSAPHFWNFDATVPDFLDFINALDSPTKNLISMINKVCLKLIFSQSLIDRP